MLTPMHEDYYTPRDLAKRFHVSLPTVKRWYSSGKIQYIKGRGIRGRILFPISGIDKFAREYYSEMVL